MNKSLSFLFFAFVLLQINIAQQPPPQLDDQAIEKMITEGRTEKDFNKLALAYYARGISNIGPGIKAKDLISDLNQSAIYYKFVKDTTNFHYAKMGIARVHIENESFFEEAITICESSIDYAKKYDKPNLLAYTYGILGQLYEARQDYDTALDMLSQAIQINDQLGNHQYQIDNLLSTCKLLLSKQETEQMISLGKLNLEKIDTLAQAPQKAELNFLLGKAYARLNRNKIALEYLKKAIDLNQGKTKLYAECSKAMYLIYEKQKNYPKAIEYRDKYQMTNDSINNYQNKEMLNRLATSYRTKEQQREIENLENERQNRKKQINQQKRLSLTLGFTALVSLVALFFLIRFYKEKIRNNNLLTEQRSSIQRQEITELENASKFNNLKSMVYGQELERNRVAQDLHDSIGGMLSAIKLQFDSLHPLDQPDKVEETAINRIHELIDIACEEVRKVSRNLKPSALENMGLEAAVRDLVVRYKSSQKMNISFHSDTGNIDIDYEMKLHLYRIIQELINNAFRHAKATELDIQIYANQQNLTLTVEDNGSGFDINLKPAGLGLNNIKSRVSLLNAELDVDSRPGQGSSFFIDVPLMNR